ncbi:MAG: acetyl-CoA acetyltransferase [Myxococcota bacterium]|nr:acetyl-CoA acetyltransferase [Myxococcota bacterium]
MTDPARQPLLVGAAAITQRETDPANAREPLELMADALEAAAADAGTRRLLTEADAVMAPRGFWEYGDPCRLLAERLGCPKARTTVAEIGVLQTTLFGEAGRQIAQGEADIVLITGGEAKYRALRAQIEGVEAPLTRHEGEADRVLRPQHEIMHPLELAFGVEMPVKQYSVMENALRHAQGTSLDEHRREIAEMWAGFSRVAASNPQAWRPEPVSADEIREPAGKNAMLAFPYTKLHNAQWNVDQAAGLVLCSESAAQRLGVARDKWLYPLAVVESNHMVPLAERKDPERCWGAKLAGERALELAGLDADRLDYSELYSCFPVAVRIQARELGIPLEPTPSVTGGMAFGGGPLNNFVLQAVARMAQVLREDPGSRGLVSAVSGILTKQGFSVWSTQPGPSPFQYDDVSEQVAGALETVEIDESADGPAIIRAYTVLCEGGEPARAVAWCDTAGGRRTLAASSDPELLRNATERELCGREITLADGEFELTRAGVD